MVMLLLLVNRFRRTRKGGLLLPTDRQSWLPLCSNYPAYGSSLNALLASLYAQSNSHHASLPSFYANGSQRLLT